MPSKGRNKSKGKKRDKRCKPRGTDSKGLRSHSKHPLTDVQRVLLGKGHYETFVPVGGPYAKGSKSAPWRGVAVVNTPYDAEQAKENERLYPHLFIDEDYRGRRAA